MSCSHCQELCLLAGPACVWLFTLVKESAFLLTQLLTMTTTHKSPSLLVDESLLLL